MTAGSGWIKEGMHSSTYNSLMIDRSLRGRSRGLVSSM